MEPAITAGMLIPVMVYLAFKSRADIHVGFFVKVMHRRPRVEEVNSETHREMATRNIGELTEMVSDISPSERGVTID
ncbi:hypothetical protein [Nocardia bovistercoris]|uniref:Uncharacterized protein n=1 Tax=Nocardia bovistercoris TaxID=2785916 RepID=A0A931N554_9NOCA|nr:hypothetical protein [Nocardia bovistercoris]MBH0779392.1 hypothetical protein [Nocardia bovistercoris]